MRLPLTLVPRPPLFLLTFLSLGHAAAVGMLWATDLTPAWLIAATLCLSWSAIATIRRLRRSQFRRLVLHGDGGVDWCLSGGREGKGKQVPGSVILGRLVLLRFEADGERVTVPVTADMFSADEFRQLRIWLRWRPPALRRSDGYS